MKKYITAAILAALTLTSCGHDLPEEEPVKTPDEIPTATMTAAEFEEDTSYYTGTFNDEVFDHIIENINYSGKRVALPCTLKDLGENIEAEIMFFPDKKNNAVSYFIKKEGAKVGTISYRYDEALTESEFEEKEIFYIDISPAWDAPKPFEVAGLYIGTIIDDGGASKEEIIERLGEPTKEYDGDQAVIISYSLENRSIKFLLQENELREVTINLDYHPDNTEE